MNIEEILDSLDDMLDRAWSLPLAGGRSVVDVEKVRELIDDVRLNMPTEIKQARAIVSDRADIIAGARKEAESIIRRAEEKSKTLIDQEEIVKQAQGKANEILTSAAKQAREMKQNSLEFADKVLTRAEETLIKSINDVKMGRQSVKSPQQNQD